MSDYLNVLLTITINPFMLIIIAGFIFTCIIERRVSKCQPRTQK